MNLLLLFSLLTKNRSNNGQQAKVDSKLLDNCSLEGALTFSNAHGLNLHRHSLFHCAACSA